MQFHLVEMREVHINQNLEHAAISDMLYLTKNYGFTAIDCIYIPQKYSDLLCFLLYVKFGC